MFVMELIFWLLTGKRTFFRDRSGLYYLQLDGWPG